jgi:hypothetical protein
MGRKKQVARFEVALTDSADEDFSVDYATAAVLAATEAEKAREQKAVYDELCRLSSGPPECSGPGMDRRSRLRRSRAGLATVVTAPIGR